MPILETMEKFTNILNNLALSGALAYEEIIDLEVIETELYSYIYNAERVLKERE